MIRPFLILSALACALPAVWADTPLAAVDGGTRHQFGWRLVENYPTPQETLTAQPRYAGTISMKAAHPTRPASPPWAPRPAGCSTTASPKSGPASAA